MSYILDDEETNEVRKIFRGMGAVVCKFGGPPDYEHVGGHFFQNVYVPQNYSFDGCKSIRITRSLREISLEEAHKTIKEALGG